MQRLVNVHATEISRGRIELTGHIEPANSAPDWLTPKYLNLVRVPKQVVDPGAEVVLVTVLLLLPPVRAVDVGVGRLVPGKHWEYPSPMLPLIFEK